MGRRTQPQWSITGLVEAPVDDVWKTLIEGNPGLTPADKTAIRAAQSAQPLTFVHGNANEGRIQFEVDTGHHRIAVQGEWWYRGVYSVDASAHGSRVSYHVYNVAPGIGWWLAQVVQGPQSTRHMKQQFDELLRAISTGLNGAAYSII